MKLGYSTRLSPQDNSIRAIRAVRIACNLGLKEAFDLVNAARANGEMALPPCSQTDALAADLLGTRYELLGVPSDASLLMSKTNIEIAHDVLQMIFDLSEDTPCEIGPETGHCFAHHWFSSDACPHGRAQALLKQYGFGV